MRESKKIGDPAVKGDNGDSQWFARAAAASPCGCGRHERSRQQHSNTTCWDIGVGDGNGGGVWLSLILSSAHPSTDHDSACLQGKGWQW